MREVKVRFDSKSKVHYGLRNLDFHSIFLACQGFGYPDNDGMPLTILPQETEVTCKTCSRLKEVK